MTDEDKKFVEDIEHDLKVMDAFGDDTTMGARLCRIIRELEEDLAEIEKAWLFKFGTKFKRSK